MIGGHRHGWSGGGSRVARATRVRKLRNPFAIRDWSRGSCRRPELAWPAARPLRTGRAGRPCSADHFSGKQKEAIEPAAKEPERQCGSAVCARSSAMIFGATLRNRCACPNSLVGPAERDRSCLRVEPHISPGYLLEDIATTNL